MLYLNHWVLRGPVRILHPLWQGKGTVTMQGRIWGRGTGNAGKWEALTQGTQGKNTCCEV